MKIYDGAMLHATNKLKTTPGELGQVVSLDLGSVPEEIVDKKIKPIVCQLADVLAEYKVYLWLTTGYHEYKNTDNEV